MSEKIAAMEHAPYALGSSTLIDALFESVRARIINGLIAPGEKLTEARLVAEYGVARPTAKVCIERLVTGGLLRRSAHKAGYVPVLSRDDVTDLYLSRRAVERSAVEILATTGQLPAAAVTSQRELVRAGEDGDFPEQVAADSRFHAALVQGTGSPRLVKMHEVISGEVALTMGLHAAHVSRAAHSVEVEHQAILDAVASGDPAAAAAALDDHLRRAQERVLSRFDDHLSSSNRTS